VCIGSLRGAGDTFIPGILNLASMWGVRIVLSLILVPSMGLHGIWIAMTVELCFRGIIFLIRTLRGKWLNKKLEM
jgi:Na+-driven multidrug efflux pump